MAESKSINITLTMYYCDWEYKFGDGLYLYFRKQRSDGKDFDGQMDITWTYLHGENLWETKSGIDGIDTKKCLLDYLNEKAKVKATNLKISKYF